MEDTLVVVVQPNLTEQQRRQVRDAAPRHRIEFPASRTEAEELAPEAVAIAGSVGDSALSAAKRLAWVHSWAAGPVVTEPMRSPDITLTSSKGNGGVPLAEHAMMLMLMLNRNALRWIDAQRDHRWERFTHDELNGRTCGIIGLGNAGGDLARKARAFHMRVIGVRRDPDAGTVDGVERIYPLDRLHYFLGESDYVVVTAPLTAETAGLLGEAEFRAMKPTSYYVCISRGGIAVDSVLERALREGWIAGAGLDAHDVEPLPGDSPFWSLPNTIVTPHNGATTPQTAQRGIDIFVENLRRFAAGEPLRNLVDKDAGY